MKMLITFLMLVLFINQSLLFGQGTKNDFDVYADRINLMISKALLQEQRYDVSSLTDSLSYDQFNGLITPPENKKLAQEIDNIKKDIADTKDLVNTLKEFFNRSLSKIPKQNNQQRQNTIQNIRDDFDNLLSTIPSASISENNNNKIPSISNSEIINEAGILDYIIWSVILVILAIDIFICTRVYSLNKDYQHFKQRFNEFEDNQKATNQKYSQKQSNVFTQKRNNPVSIPNSEIDRVKNIVFEDVIRRINEAEYLKRHSSQESPSNSPVNPSQIIQTAKCIVKYIETPEKDGYFDKNFLKNSDDIKSLYKILFYPDSHKIEYDILTDKVIIHRTAMDHSQIMLKPACEFNEEPSQSDTQIYKVDSKPGTIEEENDKLIIIDKIKIKFG